MKDHQPSIPQAQRELKVRLLPILAGLFAALYLVTGYRGWLAFLVGISGAWLLAFVWVLSLERGLSVERKVHLAWARAGESVPEELIVRNRSRLPALWLEILDDSANLPDPIRLVTDVEARATRRRHPIHRFHRRGLYTLGPTRLRTGDPFGIYSLTLFDTHATSLLVTPPQLKLAGLQIAAGGWSGDRQRRRQVLQREISEAGVREYLPGDSLRRIHWRASAHSETLMVRQVEAAASGDWWIFVDLQAQAQAGTEQDTTLELSIVLAASLASRGLRERRRVGLALSGQNLVWLEPRSGPAQRWQLLRALAMAEAGKHALTELLELGRPARSATLLVITPSTDPAWVAAAARRLQGGRMTNLLVDPFEFGGATGLLRVTQALDRERLPHARMPRRLLAEAYGSISGLEPGRRYLDEGRQAWQRLDR